MNTIALLQNILKNEILIVLSIGILILAFFSAFRIFGPIWRLRKLLDETISELKRKKSANKLGIEVVGELAENAERFDRLYSSIFPGRPLLDKQLSKYLKDWENNIIPFLNDEKLSTVSPDAYFSPEQLLPVDFSYRLMRAVPGVLTTCGIFGTFIGLSIGLFELSLSLSSGSNSTAPDPARISQGILSLMDNMSTAFTTSVLGIGLALIWIWGDRAISRRIDLLLDELRINLRNLLPHLDTGNAWRFFIQFSAEQNNSLKNLSQDLATNLSNSLNKTIGDHLKPQADAMLRVVEKMADFTSETQIKGMEKLLERFGDLVGERLKEQFNNLAETIDVICTWQRTVKDQLDIILNNVQLVTEQQNNMLINASRAAELFQESLGELGTIHQHLSEATGRFESLLFSLETHSKTTAHINAELSKAMNSFSTVAHESLESLAKQSGHIQEASETSYQQIEALNKHLASTLDQQLDNMQKVIENSENQLEIFIFNLTSNLEHLSQNMNNAMEQFSQQCREGMGLTFSEFDKNLAGLTHALSGTILQIEETVQELLGKIVELDKSVRDVVNTQNKFSNTADNISKYHDNIAASLTDIIAKFQQLTPQLTDRKDATAVTNS